jgi:hypothetical protein
VTLYLVLLGVIALASSWLMRKSEYRAVEMGVSAKLPSVNQL